MSIISCTSPRASEVILPASTLTSVARSALCSTSSSPSRATSAPRTGAGVVRHVAKAAAASAIAASVSSAVVSATLNSTSPVIGVLACTPSAPGSPSSVCVPMACSAVRTRARRSSAVGSAVVGVCMVVMMPLSRRGRKGRGRGGRWRPPSSPGCSGIRRASTTAAPSVSRLDRKMPAAEAGRKSS